MIKTVAELIEALQKFPRETPVIALWDTMPSFEIHRVELFRGVATVDCGSGPNGDWDTLENRE